MSSPALVVCDEMSEAVHVRETGTRPTDRQNEREK